MRIENWLYTLPLRLRSLFRPDRLDLELDEELRAHIQRQVDANREHGMSTEQARTHALIALGGLEHRKQQCREIRGVHWIQELGHDVSYGLRTMRRSPGFTVSTLLILALGIGAATTIFSADHALLFRKLPYRDPGRLVDIFQKEVSDPVADRMLVAPANYLDWQASSHLFEAFAAWQPTSLNLNGGANPERVRAARVSANLFSVLGVEPMLGRLFQSGEDTPGRGQLVILSYPLWQRRFAGTRDIVGKTLRANDQTYTIIGVMPPDFRFPIAWVSSDVEAWTPLVLTSAQRTSRKDISLMVVARLSRGVPLAQAQSALAAVARHLADSYPDADKDWSVNITPMSDAGVSDFRGLFDLLSAAVILVLLIACANVSNLLLGRGMTRQKELSVRSALGARRSRLIRQLMTEGLLLSLCGSALGIGLGSAGIRVLAYLAPTGELPDLKHMTLDAPIIALTLALSVLAGILFSIIPALASSGTALHGTLQETGRANTGTVLGHRLRSILVIAELALTLGLLLCAGDILNSFLAYMRVDPGFDPSDVLTMRFSISKQKNPTPQQWAATFNQAIEQLATVPGITAVAAGSGAPMEGGGSVLRFHLEAGKPSQHIDERSILEYLRVTPAYFSVTGMKLLRGRDLLDSDKGNTPSVVVINEALARKQFGNADPIGKRIFLDGDVNASAAPESGATPLEIVGVVRDIKEYGLFHMTPQMIFVPMDQDPDSSLSLLLKTTVPPETVLPAVRAKMAEISSDQPVYNVRSLQKIFWNEHAFFRFNTLLLTLFAAMALILSLTGLYAVMSYAVSQRIREFGIRLALGSPRNKILGLVLKQGASICLIGIVLGLALGWPATRLLARVLKESMYLTLVRSGSILLPALCAAMALTMMIACLLPARRAVKADPVEALRTE